MQNIRSLLLITRRVARGGFMFAVATSTHPPSVRMENVRNTGKPDSARAKRADSLSL